MTFKAKLTVRPSFKSETSLTMTLKDGVGRVTLSFGAHTEAAVVPRSFLQLQVIPELKGLVGAVEPDAPSGYDMLDGTQTDLFVRFEDGVSLKLKNPDSWHAGPALRVAGRALVGVATTHLKHEESAERLAYIATKFAEPEKDES